MLAKNWDVGESAKRLGRLLWLPCLSNGNKYMAYKDSKCLQATVFQVAKGANLSPLLMSASLV